MAEHILEPMAAIKPRQASTGAAWRAHETKAQPRPAPDRDLLAGLSALPGGTPAAHAMVLSRVASSQPARAPRAFQQLQRQYGNRHVQRVVEAMRSAQNETEATAEVETAIAGARGAGQPLDSNVRGQMETAFDADFGGVRVHTDSQADALNRAVHGRAFTTGQDIFFRAGEYNPQSSSGRELLAHELTHVVQQTGAVRHKLAISQPGDEYEQEADRAARAVMQPETATGSLLAREPERQDEEGPGFLGTIGGGLIGEFNEDPSFAMIGVDLGVSLIPILDQASDIRDIAAHLYYMIFHNQYDRFMRWLGLVFTLIGLFPEVGSAIKGASKFVIKGVREVLSHLGDLLRPFRRILPDLVDFGRLHRYVATNWNHWMAIGLSAWERMIGRLTSIANAILTSLNRRLRAIREGLDRVRQLAPAKLREGFAWARRKWDEIMEQLGRREGGEAAETTTQGTGRARRAEETAEQAGEKASQLPRAIVEARAIAEANDLVDAPIPVVLGQLTALQTRYRWIRGFTGRKLGRGRYQIILLASEHMIDPNYTYNVEAVEGEYESFTAMLREEGGTGEFRAVGEPVSMQPYGGASKARETIGVTGDHQAMHLFPQAVGRHMPGYNPRTALTLLEQRATHFSMDQHWKEAFQTMRRNGRTTATAQEIYTTVVDSIRKAQGLSPGLKKTLEARLEDEMFVEFKLMPTEHMPLPYPNIGP